MAEYSLPWAGLKSEGAAGDAGGYSDSLFADALEALIENRTGVLQGLNVQASNPAGASVTLTAGKAIIKGRVYILDADMVINISDNTSGNPRKDRVVLRCNYDSGVQTIRAVVKEGTPAGSPTTPSLTQNEGVMWELSMGIIDVANSFSTISQAEITRDRIWATTYWPGDLKPTFNGRHHIDGHFVVADGSAISRTDYPGLFDILGTTYGVGDGSTTFNLPDLRGRDFKGRDNQGGTSANRITATAADAMGGSMGEEKHTLTEAELAPHTHLYSQGLISNNFAGGGGGAQVDGGSNNDTTGSTGSGTPFNVTDPSIFGLYYIYAGDTA